VSLAAPARGARRGPSGRGDAPAQRAGGGRRRYWVVALVVAGAVGFLLAKGLGSSIVYFKTADEAVADRAQLGGQTFRIEGVVVPGTVHQSTGQVVFDIRSKAVTVPVVNDGSPPQLFQPNIPVVLEGHFQGAGDRFLSDQIMVKHSAVYVAQHPDRVKAPDGSSR
jgi:cytochrome c-type biogenesis protein CcmE